ncbi:MAG TPA: hypothetical protein VFV50_11680 [Bdellovibrionales bacterium]|nr:hypothetical protein [Bdellovibrionales bacterium]
MRAFYRHLSTANIIAFFGVLALGAAFYFLGVKDDPFYGSMGLVGAVIFLSIGAMLQTPRSPVRVPKLETTGAESPVAPVVFNLEGFRNRSSRAARVFLVLMIMFILVFGAIGVSLIRAKVMPGRDASLIALTLVLLFGWSGYQTWRRHNSLRNRTAKTRGREILADGAGAALSLALLEIPGTEELEAHLSALGFDVGEGYLKFPWTRLKKFRVCRESGDREDYPFYELTLETQNEELIVRCAREPLLGRETPFLLLVRRHCEISLEDDVMDEPGSPAAT